MLTHQKEGWRSPPEQRCPELHHLTATTACLNLQLELSSRAFVLRHKGHYVCHPSKNSLSSKQRYQVKYLLLHASSEGCCHWSSRTSGWGWGAGVTAAADHPEQTRHTFPWQAPVSQTQSALNNVLFSETNAMRNFIWKCDVTTVQTFKQALNISHSIVCYGATSLPRRWLTVWLFSAPV